MSSQPWTIPGADGEPIFGNAHLPGGDALGTLLIAHGFKGYKDYGFLPVLAAHAAEAGFVAHRFNFSHSGMTNRIETFERPDLFERDTWGKQAFDMRAVSAAAARGELPGGVGGAQVWFGHSRGGVTCLLAAADALQDGQPVEALRGIVTAGSPHECARVGDEDRATLLEAGRLLSPSGRTGQDLYVGKAWLEEVENDPERFSPYRAAGLIDVPRLIVHGTSDVTVPASSAHAYADAVGGRGELHLIENASHVFDAPNPLDPDGPMPPATCALIRATLDFASRCTGG